MVPSHYMEQFHPKYNDSIQETDDLTDRYDNPPQYPDMPSLGPWRVEEFVSGERARYVRNPYYWKVDPEGRQLPYIDRMDVSIVGDEQVILLKAIAGELDAQFRPHFAMKDVPFLRENEESGDYRVIMWNRGDMAWPWLIIAYDYADEGIVDLLYASNLRRALSVAIDRERINDIVTLGLGKPRQASALESMPVYSAPEGKEIHDQWTYGRTEHDPQQASDWLDEIGVVDANGNGWRDRPDGSELELVIECVVGDDITIDSLDFIKEGWESVGLKTTLKSSDGTVVNERWVNQEIMIRAWGSAACDWLLMMPCTWSPAYACSYTMGGYAIGQWNGTDGKEGIPPRSGSMLERLQEAYNYAMDAIDHDERFARVLEGYKIHVEEGPISIGTVGEHASPCVVKDSFRNVMDWALTAAWSFSFPGTSDPEQFFFLG